MRNLSWFTFEETLFRPRSLIVVEGCFAFEFRVTFCLSRAGFPWIFFVLWLFFYYYIKIKSKGLLLILFILTYYSAFKKHCQRKTRHKNTVHLPDSNIFSRIALYYRDNVLSRSLQLLVSLGGNSLLVISKYWNDLWMMGLCTLLAYLCIF